MAEKHFKYEGKGKLGMKTADEVGVKAQILQMNIVTPMSIKFKLSEDAAEATGMFFLDFVSERVSGMAGQEVTGAIGDAILEILVAKKNEIRPTVTEALKVQKEKSK